MGSSLAWPRRCGIGHGGLGCLLALLLSATPIGAQASAPAPPAGPTAPTSGPAAAPGLTDLDARIGVRPGRRELPPPADLPDVWTSLPDMPQELAEVCAARIGSLVYVTGKGSEDTLTLDLTTLDWDDDLVPPRPYEGQHQSAEVWGERMYLIGGIKNGSPGELQIYDPLTNAWTLGAPMPWEGGSCCTALIDGKIYVSGGIIDNSYTTDETAAYDPSTDTWTLLAPMPAARNHAATATDGERLWVFGGRGPGSGDTNTVANGFGNIQVYDPATDTWEDSDDPASSLSPMPIGRGGMGKAVFYAGEFFVLGGETDDGPGADVGGVYDRVDVYDPVTNTWRAETDMPTARHGIFPVLVDDLLIVAGGGTDSGSSDSDVVEVLRIR